MHPDQTHVVNSSSLCHQLATIHVRSVYNLKDRVDIETGFVVGEGESIIQTT